MVFGRPRSSRNFKGQAGGKWVWGYLEKVGVPKHGGDKRWAPPFAYCSCCMKDHQSTCETGVFRVFTTLLLLWLAEDVVWRPCVGVNSLKFLFVLFPTSNQRASAVDFTLLFTSLFFIPCQGLIAVGIMATCFSKTATERETLARIGVTLLYNHVQVITYIPSPLPHPLVRSKSQVLFTLKGRGLNKSVNTRRHDEGVLLTIPGLSDHFGKPAVCKVTQDLDCWRLVISGRVRQGKGTEVWQKPWQTLCRP